MSQTKDRMADERIAPKPEHVEFLRANAQKFADRFAPVYRLLGWTWGDAERSYVPDEADIVRAVNESIDVLRVDPKTSKGRVSTGGFDVWIDATGHGIAFVDDFHVRQFTD